MVFYAIAKYLVYSSWCYVGLRLRGSQATSVRPALGFGAVRWLLGLGFGILVFLAVGSVDRSSLAVLYFAIYTPLRVLEWTVMAWLIYWFLRLVISRFTIAAILMAGVSSHR